MGNHKEWPPYYKKLLPRQLFFCFKNNSRGGCPQPLYLTPLLAAKSFNNAKSSHLCQLGKHGLSFTFSGQLLWNALNKECFIQRRKPNLQVWIDTKGAPFTEFRRINTSRIPCSPDLLYITACYTASKVLPLQSKMQRRYPC